MIVFRHTFCGKCLFDWLKNYSTCPECREEVIDDLIGKDLIAESLIQDLEVDCPSKFCSWKHALLNLPLHLQACEYRCNSQRFSDFPNEKNVFEIETYGEEGIIPSGKEEQNHLGDFIENKNRALEQYQQDLLHCIEECAVEEQKEGLYFFSEFFNFSRADILGIKELQESLTKIEGNQSALVSEQHKYAEKKRMTKKRGYKVEEFEHETEHVLKKSKLVK